MERKIAGIDLGTTNSVIAIPGEYPEKGTLTGPVTVIGDEANRMTQASAVVLVDGQLVVGDDAKDMAAQGFTPVRFVKKYMGTKCGFKVGDEEWSPEKVSAAVLKHMAAIAEKALGVKIDAAVVTHPAYFDALAINATKEAAKLAGLNVEGKLMMEPVAAAMYYTYKDPQPHLRVLVYDLGGGTFDITLVERTAGTFCPVSFGGDRELGGYNFDKKIATRMLQELRQKNYVLTIDPDQPERDPRWASLMHHAEKVKFKLSDSQKADLRIPGVFKDDSKPPKSVSLAFSLTRKDFLEMIEPELAKTMRLTKEVLQRANLTPEDVTHLVLVGGSCRIPAIRERLQREFGIEPKYDEDVLDLSVAVGAAMVAMTSGTTEKGEAVNVGLKFIPESTDDPILTFSGQVEPSAKYKNTGDFSVTVAGGSQGEQSTLTSGDGKFYLEVELASDSDNELALVITAPDGTEVFQKSYRVTHSKAASAPPPPPAAILPKPIAVETMSGLIEMAKEGDPLPFKSTQPTRCKTLEEFREVPVNFYQEDIQLATLLLPFPRPVPAGTFLDLSLEIGADYSMKITAVVQDPKMQKTLDVQLRPPPVRSADELREEFRTVRELYDSQLQNMPDGELKMRTAAECDRIIEEIEELLTAEFPERLQIEMLIKKLYIQTKQMAVSTGLSPSKRDMDAKFEDVKELLPQAVAKKPALKEQNLGATIKALEAEAKRAYQETDATAWSRVAAKLDELIGALKGIIEGGAGGRPNLPPPPQLLMALVQFAGLLRSQLAESVSSKKIAPDNAARCRKELDAADGKLKGVNLVNGDQATQEMIGILQQHLIPVRDALGVQARSGIGIDIA